MTCDLLQSALQKQDEIDKMDVALSDSKIRRLITEKHQNIHAFNAGNRDESEFKIRHRYIRNAIKLCRVYRYEIVFGGSYDDYKKLMISLRMTPDEYQAYKKHKGF